MNNRDPENNQDYGAPRIIYLPIGILILGMIYCLVKVARALIF